MEKLENQRVLNCQALAAEIIEEIKREVVSLKSVTGITPGLAAISLGEELSGQIFLRRKRVACDKAGINFFVNYLPKDSNLDEILEIIYSLNNDSQVHGIIVHLPIPTEMDLSSVFQAIDYRKDIDALHPLNMGKLLAGTATLVPATLAAIVEILDRQQIELVGKRVLILGREEGFAKPLAMLLVQRFATVSVATHWDQRAEGLLGKAEIVISDLRKHQIIKGQMLAPGAIVIDLGFNMVNGKLVGDLELDKDLERAQLVIPVPGGIGPLIISMLLKNTLVAYRKQLFGPSFDEETIWRKGR
jgi:methylenetetrahydrofolate dehydrogenase (NADP+)/methenyltetrahydrofolate cyclohydrolase